MAKGDVLGSATVPGAPVPKKRARTFTTKTGKISAYTPKETVEYELSIGKAWLGKRYFAGPVDVVIEVYEGVMVGHHKPADLDNFIKTALDALNGIAVEDDKQVVHIDATLTRDCANPSLTVIFLEH